MVSFNGESVDSQSQYTNATVQSQQGVCGVQQNVNISNTTVVVENTTVKGDVTAVRVGTTADANCMMSNQMSQQVYTALETSLQQSAATQSDLFSLLEGINLQNVQSNVTKDVANKLTQYAANTCYTQNNVDVNNTYQYFGGGSANNISGVVIDGLTANASCAMSNFGKLLNYLEDSTDFQQDSSKKGTLGAIFGIFGVLIVVIIGIVVLVVALSIFKKGGKKKNGTDGMYSVEQLNALMGIA